MQVVRTRLTRQCPFILESDVLSLSSDFISQQNGSVLYDSRLGARHIIHAPGHHIVAALATGLRYDALEQLAAKHGIAHTQLCELLGFLNTTGGLAFGTRTMAQRVRAARVQLAHLMLGVRYAVRVWRRPASLLHLSVASLRACLPIVAALVIVGGIYAGSGIAAPLQVMGISLFGMGVFISSLCVHEYAHVVAVRKAASAVVLQHGMRLGIVHRGLPPAIEIASAVAGPVAGMLWCTAITVATIATGHTLLAAFAGCAGVFQLTSFIPWYGDGQSIRAAIKQQRSEANTA